MSLICLVGRHGSGKSTIGAALASQGAKHISVGLMRRLAAAGQMPADIPASLMAAIRRAKPGAVLSCDVATKLLRFAASFEHCVLDGFPSTYAHIDMLPPAAIVGVVWTPYELRLARLNKRSDTSKRIWTPGRPSEREQSLAGVIKHARAIRRVVFIPNRRDGEIVLDDAVRRLTV